MNNFSPAEKFIIQKLENELPHNLTYHGLHHTFNVLKAAIKIAGVQNLSEGHIKLLRLAALYHDAGFISTYKNHEEKSCELAMKYLPSYNLNSIEILTICRMIMVTKVPQSPVTRLEKIICDADLDYLGGKDFYKISSLLYAELKMYTNIKDENEWNDIQIKFLKKHRYYTEFSRRNRDPQKQKYLREIGQLVSIY